ncbi:MAG: hypothetical protein AAFY47_05665 [Pseudomonadota bacterium]
MLFARRLVPFLAVALACAALAPGAAQKLEDVDLAAERAAIGKFQDRDQRLQDIGWQMIRGNAEFCERVIPSIGLQLQDTASYGRPDIAKAALELEGAFAVQTAAAGSPAALSGAFVRNREITDIAAADPNGWEAGKRMHWERLARAHDWIDTALAETGEVTIGFADGPPVTIQPVEVCATRFEILGDSKRAVADGSRVVIGSRFPGFAYEEDAVFAGVVAHELAHNLLGHRAWLDRNKRKRRHVRLTEREADRLMPWIMANAGLDPAGAYRFMTRWGKKHGLGIFRSRSYDGWDERAEFIAAELPIIAELMEREGKADWRVHFRREIDPGLGLEIAQSAPTRD